MATKRKKTTVKRRKHHRRVGATQPSVVNGMRKKRRTHRKKVSGITGNDILDLLIGTAIGTGLDIAIEKLIPSSVDEKIKHFGKVIAGAGAMYFGDKKKNMLIIGAGASLTSSGLKEIAEDMGVVQGIHDFMAGMGLVDKDEDTLLISMNGTMQDQPSIVNGHNDFMGTDMPSVVN